MESYSRFSADIESTNAFGSIQFVATDGQQVNIVLIHIDGNLANSLSSICVEEHLIISADLPNFLNWLNHTNLVVYMDDRSEECIGSDGTSEFIKINQTISLHWQVSDIKALIF
jgi:hypothetical protein